MIIYIDIVETDILKSHDKDLVVIEHANDFFKYLLE